MDTIQVPNLTVPDWAMPWLAVAAAAALIFKLRRFAFGLLLLPIGRLLFPMLVPPGTPLPYWLMPLTEVVASLIVLQAALTLIFGREIAVNVISDLVIRGLNALWRGPGRLLTSVWRAFSQ